MNHFSATYDPADNKLRLRAVHRLDAELYARVKAAGFSWAPRQELFVAPMWTPQREDLLLELCGEIEDEDTTLVDRAESRADRFEGYKDRRAADAHAAHAHVARIADGIPMGQPILVGHHSERHARKDAQRIENGMRKAVKMWETSQYWQRRAAGALAHAKYKELPGVRARRIKKLEADKSKHERTLDKCESMRKLWMSEKLTHKLALLLADQSHQSIAFTLEKYPRAAEIDQSERPRSVWSALDAGIINLEQARALLMPGIDATIAWAKRWIIHFEMRLIYENCMLEESGYVAPKKVKTAKQTLPLCNYRSDSIAYENPYRKEVIVLGQKEMTKAEYAKIWKDYKGTRIVEGSHKVRTAMIGHQLFAVFLTDSKMHEKPEAVTPSPVRLPEPRAPRPSRPATPPERTVFDDMKQSLKTGVQVVSAPQLFPTPRWLAERMVDLLKIELGHSVLEPSAGTGVLLDALRARHPHMNPHAIEINLKLAADLRLRGYHCDAFDFLERVHTLDKFDRVVMNPPFGDAADIAHIQAAIALLKPGGRVVAICADGPRQNTALKPLAATWEKLPEGTFASQGTNVRTVLATFKAG
jgi:phospholipid N-methyltransferase